jgi:hypothetical protein
MTRAELQTLAETIHDTKAIPRNPSEPVNDRRPGAPILNGINATVKPDRTTIYVRDGENITRHIYFIDAVGVPCHRVTQHKRRMS